jgi:hypothetical protein
MEELIAEEICKFNEKDNMINNKYIVWSKLYYYFI